MLGCKIEGCKRFKYDLGVNVALGLPKPQKYVK